MAKWLRHVACTAALAGCCTLACGSCRRVDTVPQDHASPLATVPQDHASPLATVPQDHASPLATVTPPPPSSERDVTPPPPPSSNLDVIATPKTPIAEPSTTTRPTACRLLAVGDSLTDQRSGGGGYLDVLERACGCIITNLGKGGDMVNQMKSRLNAHYASTQDRYHYVLVFGGVNDLYSDQTAHRTVTKIERDLESMYRSAHNHGAKVIALTVAPWGGFRRYYNERRAATTRELNAFIEQSPAEGRVEFAIDAYSLLSCGHPERLCESYAAPYKDGLHFGPRGHERLGVAIARAIGKGQCPAIPDDGSTPPKGPKRTEEVPKEP